MTYDYRCAKCSTEITVERSIHAEASNPSCLSCDEVMNPVYSAAGIIFKSKGFYKTS